MQLHGCPLYCSAKQFLHERPLYFFTTEQILHTFFPVIFAKLQHFVTPLCFYAGTFNIS
jgi:hypothetical protein